jgi:uroporphyrinogen-III synthase
MSLSGWQVVIMRPEHQAGTLVNTISERQGTPILFPTLEIIPLSFSPQVQADWDEFARRAAFLLVTSSNAMRFAPRHLMTTLQQNPVVKIVTMGEATSNAVREQGLSVFYTAQSGTTSESLLKSDFFQASTLKAKAILILAGIGGRTLLAEELQSRQAEILVAKVYRQQIPNTTMADKLNPWQQKGRLCFVATSLNCLENALILAKDQVQQFKGLPLVVVSERIANKAAEWGFKQIFITKGADPLAICATLQAMAQVCDTMT